MQCLHCEKRHPNCCCCRFSTSAPKCFVNTFLTARHARKDTGVNYLKYQSLFSSTRRLLVEVVKKALVESKSIKGVFLQLYSNMSIKIKNTRAQRFGSTGLEQKQSRKCAPGRCLETGVYFVVREVFLGKYWATFQH